MQRKSDNTLLMYWKAYGGFRAFWCSSYLLTPLLITLFCSSHWLNNAEWISDPLSVIPSLLGFTLAGYAMWLSVGNEKLKIVLSSKIDLKKNQYSVFMQINASFLHFVILQIFALIFLYFLKYNSLGVILNKIQNSYLFSNGLLALIEFLSNFFNGLGFFLFIYSIYTMLATVLGIFRISYWIDSQNRIMLKNDNNKKCPDCCGEISSEARKCMHCGCNFEPLNSDKNPS